MKLTKRQLRKIIKEEKRKLVNEARGDFEQDGVIEAEAALSSAARVLLQMGYEFQDICDVVDEATSGPDVALP